MTVNELKKVVDEVVAAGNGGADVVFDTEARSFHFHYLKIDSACFDDIPGMNPILGLYTDYHLSDGITDTED